ncbi:MAG: ribose transporter, permease protein [Actinomycetota bacterium]
MTVVTNTQVEPDVTTPKPEGRKRIKNTNFRMFGGPFIGLVVMVIVFSLLSPYFLTAQNFSNLLQQVSILGIMAAGATLVILIGGIDLSVAAVMAFTLMFSAWLYKSIELPFVLALLAGLLMGALIGLVNGLLSTFGKIQPFVATLATMSMCLGLALLITNGSTINDFPEWFGELAVAKVWLIPVQAILMFAIFGVAAFWLKYRPLGRSLYAIGGNEEVARLSGLPVRWTKTLVYVIASSLAAVAGWLNMATLDSAQPTAAGNYLLNVIAVVVIGGASLAGGVGTMGSTLLGLFVVGVINNGMSFTGINPNAKPVVIGLIIILAVLADRKTAAST